MEGDPMQGVLRPEFLAEHPIREIETHTPPGWFEKRRSVAVTEHRPEARLEQLRSLGYVE
jgi:hypothetical protein